MNAKIRHFSDLDAWKEGHKLVLSVYRLSKFFPREEMFGLVSQMRRAAVSITSNIAEGFSRKTAREKIQFYFLALGSVTELQNQCIIARDTGFIAKDNFQNLFEQLIRIHKIINGLVKSAQNRP